MTHPPLPEAEIAKQLPIDIRKAADAVADALVEHALIVGDQVRFDKGKARMIVAVALEAERQRCLSECDYVLENIRVRKSERKRFDIYDMNRTFKGAVNCVRERIEGDWEKNWKPAPDVAPVEA